MQVDRGGAADETETAAAQWTVKMLDHVGQALTGPAAARTVYGWMDGWWMLCRPVAGKRLFDPLGRVAVPRSHTISGSSKYQTTIAGGTTLIAVGGDDHVLEEKELCRDYRVRLVLSDVVKMSFNSSINRGAIWHGL